MKNISEYDQRQLQRMLDCLNSFEARKVSLDSLVGSLEFLISAMESVEVKWEDKFFNEITILETISAIDIIAENEEVTEIRPDNTDVLVGKSVFNLKQLIGNE